VPSFLVLYDGGMEKDFEKWHQKKSGINDLTLRPFFHEREIWFAYVGVNIGFEQDGQGDDFLRPIIVLKKFNNEIFWAIPLTKSHKHLTEKTSLYYFDFSFIPQVMSRAVLSQMRLMDARRLSRKMSDVSEIDFSHLMKKLRDLIP
jgi:mRNA interferase MazF